MMPGLTKKKLFTQVAEGDLDGLKETLGEKDPNNYISQYGDTLLGSAVEHDQIEIVQYLLSKNADVNAKGYEGNSPLMYAFDIENKERQAAMVKTLFELAEPNLELTNVDHRTALDKAFRSYSFASLAAIMEGVSDKKSLFESSVHGESFAGKILSTGNLEIIKKAQEHYTFKISSAGAADYAKKLVAKNKTETLKYFMETEKSFQKISPNHITDLCFSAVTKDAQKSLELLLPLIEDINAKNADDRTLLVVAIREKQQANVKLLIEAGVDIDIQCQAQWTALHHAAYSNDTKMVKLLLEAGAITELKTEKEMTARQVALENGAEDTVKLLKESQANSWKKENENEIVFFEEKPVANLSIRDIFNFKTQEYLRVVQDTANGHISHETTSFDQVSQDRLTEAFNELKKQGGLKDAAAPVAHKVKKVACLTLGQKKQQV